MSMSKNLILVAVFAFSTALLLGGCGYQKQTPDTGSTPDVTQTVEKPGEVTFTSIPLGIDVYIDGEYKGTTPITLKLEDGRKFKVEFKKEEFNYATETREIDNKAGTVTVTMRKQN